MENDDEIFLGKLSGGVDTRPASIHDNVDNVDGLARVAYERRIERLEQENKELSRKLVDTTKTLQEVVSITMQSGLTLVIVLSPVIK